LQATVLDRLDWLALVQLADRRCGHRSEPVRCMPGQGTLPLTEWIHRLERANYGGYYEFEIFGDSDWDNGFQLLEGLVRRIPALFTEAATQPLDGDIRPEVSPDFQTLRRADDRSIVGI
jgi:sugar phosphate isomerase/epimerase